MQMDQIKVIEDEESSNTAVTMEAVRSVSR
jgi:hypothetical protein